MGNPTLRKRLFAAQAAQINRHNLLVTLRSYMNDKGIDKKVLRAMDKESAHLSLLIEGYGWATCCIPPDEPAGE